jgi:hypothetical protein
MATITAQSLIDKAATILQDATSTRWPAEELLDWLNDGQREVVLFKPDANPVSATVALVEGTKQSIPSEGLQLLDVIRNMAGTSPGLAVRLIGRRTLDEQLPDWHKSTSVSEAKHYLFDERDPRTFWVYPPSDGTGEAEILYSAAPSDIAANDTLGVDDTYANALLDYILYRAYLKDADYAANDQRASNQHQRFMQALGVLDKKETRGNPYVRNKAPVVEG